MTATTLSYIRSSLFLLGLLELSTIDSEDTVVPVTTAITANNIRHTPGLPSIECLRRRPYRATKCRSDREAYYDETAYVCNMTAQLKLRGMRGYTREIINKFCWVDWQNSLFEGVWRIRILYLDLGVHPDSTATFGFQFVQVFVTEAFSIRCGRVW